MADSYQSGGTTLPEAATKNIQFTNSAYEAARKAEELGLTITSGWRSQEQNAAVGGIKGSDHTKGAAYDVAGPQSAMDAFAEWAKNSGLFDYTLWQTEGHYDHVHVSWNPDGTAAETTQTGTVNNPGGIMFGFIRLAMILVLILIGLFFFFGAFPQTEAVNKQAKKSLKGVMNHAKK